MRWAMSAVVGVIVVSGCGQAAPNAYPPEAKAHFESTCPPESQVCACTWDQITRTLTYEEYEAALARLRTEGLMDPRVTRARGKCLERHPS